MLLSSYLWVVQVIGTLTPPPPRWSGVIIGAVFALVPPLVTYRIWRSDRRATTPLALRIQRAALTASLLGVLSLLLFVSTHLAS